MLKLLRFCRQRLNLILGLLACAGGLLLLLLEHFLPCSAGGCTTATVSLVVSAYGTPPERHVWASFGAAPVPAASTGRLEPADVTVTTALFDIRRAAFDGRSMRNYLRWFRSTLALPVSMVIYTQPGEFANFVLRHRAGQLHHTVLVLTNLTQLPYAAHRARIEDIMEDKAYRARIRERNRVECRLPDYIVVQYSKFGLLTRTAAANPFRSRYFLWLDAGAGRWLSPIAASVAAWPDAAKLGALLDSGRFLIQRMVADPPACDASRESEQLWGNLSYLVGTLFGGTAETLSAIEAAVAGLFGEMLAGRMMNNEQIALWVLYCRHPHLFAVVPRTYTPRGLRLRPFRKKDADWLTLAANLAPDVAEIDGTAA